ncbi:MAG: hypothetical protein IIB09_09900 [Bacteroidetes bacterium]|nr:hypothetical protein [Bacteroidota bacterium]
MQSKNSIDSVIEHYKRDVDLSLLKENLKLTPAERVLRLMELATFADELKRAGRTIRQNS